MLSRNFLALAASSGLMTLASDTVASEARRSSAPMLINWDMSRQPLPRIWVAILALVAGSLILLSRSMTFKKVSLALTVPSLAYSTCMPSSSNRSGDLPSTVFILPMPVSTVPASIPRSPVTSSRRDASSTARPVAPANLSADKARSWNAVTPWAANVAMAPAAAVAKVAALSLMPSKMALEPALNLPMVPSAWPTCLRKSTKAASAALMPRFWNSVTRGIDTAIRSPSLLSL